MKRTRVVHCRKSAFDVLIDRTTKWGNPFTHIKDRATKALVLVNSRQESIASFERWFPTQPHLVASLHELQGRVLGCWCKPRFCHGDVLARLADACVQPYYGVTVTIQGRPGSGRSTVGRVISQALSAAGLTVSEDPDDLQLDDALQDARVRSLRETGLVVGLRVKP